MKHTLLRLFAMILFPLIFIQCEQVDEEQIQKPGPQPNPDGTIEEAPVYPNKPILPEFKDVGIYTDPAVPDADKPCTVYFEPKEGGDFYKTSDELYLYSGLYIEEDWKFAKVDWNDNTEILTKVSDNKWSFEITPSIREYYGAGEISLPAIALIIKNEEGDKDKQTKPDCILPLVDNKYPFSAFQPDDVVVKTMPSGLEHGINYNSDGSVTLVFKELNKLNKRYDYCYLLNEENEWKREPEFMMYRDNAAGCWWYTISADKIDPDKEYMFQYHLGNQKKNLRIADPYSEIIYDEWNDKYITSSTYPDMPVYPKTKRLVSAFKVNRDNYNWEVPDFKVKDQNDLIIYELLIRDFTKTKDLNGALTKLDYLKELGITAIELMPVQEFDGNDSWGYNPNHYFALDKAYGNRETYKKFIDECHKRGIAVLFDVVYNHATGIAPMAELYFSGDKTSAVNPWFNVNSPHGFGVFHDWNHENMEVRQHIKRSLKYLLEEYHIDGFRFDLTKGFTQKSGMDNRYDQSRVDILKDYNSAIKTVNPDAVVILEHFVDPENVELGKNGMKVWRNCSSAYQASGAGKNANFTYLKDGYEPFGTCVGFMESHDEERTLLPWPGESQSAAAVRRSAAKENISWGLVGTFNNWGNPDASGHKKPDHVMNADGKYLVAQNVTLTTDDLFKIRANNDWDDNYNYGARNKDAGKLSVGVPYEMELGAGSGNLSVTVAGIYDVVFELSTKYVWVMEPGKRPGAVDPQPDPEPDTGVKPLFPNTALGRRMSRGALNAAFFLTVPGPKMIWQFGELGYDISIEEGGRTASKPVHWEYYDVPERKMLYDVYAGLLKFRADNPRFFDMDAQFQWYVDDAAYPCKTIYCNVDGKSFMVIGNFSQNAQSDIKIDFKANGNWRNWFDPEDKYNGNQTTTTLRGNEFRLYVNF